MNIKFLDEEIDFNRLPFERWNLYKKIVKDFFDVRRVEKDDPTNLDFFTCFTSYIDEGLFLETDLKRDKILNYLKDSELTDVDSFIKYCDSLDVDEFLVKQVFLFKKNLLNVKKGMDYDLLKSHDNALILIRTNICSYDDFFDKLDEETKDRLEYRYCIYLLEESSGDTWFLAININDITDFI